MIFNSFFRGLGGNKFSGAIPGSFKRLEKLVEFGIGRNFFTAIEPEALSGPAIKTLYAISPPR